jgi:hypothetical protein
MKRAHALLASLVCLGLVATASMSVFAAGKQTASCVATEPLCYHGQFDSIFDELNAVAVPKIATPSWLAAQQTPAPTTSVTYTIATRGNVAADVGEFTAQVNETLNSPNGWSRLGVAFQQVESDGRFTVWLSEASQVPSFSTSGCDTVVSCTVGNNVIINETRWMKGSDAWNGAGGSLRDYRHMVVNHEIGHWLGHGHRYCSGANQLAPVMQQQTIDMQGCTPNPWPQSQEMYSPKLGIRS